MGSQLGFLLISGASGMEPRHIFKENIYMDFEKINVRYLEKLLNGDRNGCREVLGQALQTGTPANTVYTELFWPVMKIVESLFRENRIDTIAEKIATRINRTLVDQLQSKLHHKFQFANSNMPKHQLVVLKKNLDQLQVEYHKLLQIDFHLHHQLQLEDNLQ